MRITIQRAITEICEVEISEDQLTAMRDMTPDRDATVIAILMGAGPWVRDEGDSPSILIPDPDDSGRMLYED